MNGTLKKHVVDRAIIDTMSGHGSELHEVATHVHPMTPSSEHDIFAAGTSAWKRRYPAARSGAIWSAAIGRNAGLTATAA